MASPASFTGLLIVPESTQPSQLGSTSHVMTLGSFHALLLSHFAPELSLASPAAVRIALSHVAPEVVARDPWLGPIAKRGGRAWLRIVESLDAGQTSLFDRVDSLRIVAQGDDDVATRARLFLVIIQEVEQQLLGAGLLDPRREAETLADLVAHSDARDIERALPSARLAARGITDWRASDLALWRALDASLSRVGGSAVIELPVVDKPLDAERMRDPLEALMEAVAGALDDAPVPSPVQSAVGDLVARIPSPRAAASVEVRQALSIESQAQAVADAVESALERGMAPDGIVVALVSEEERVAREIVRALRDASVPCVDDRRLRSRSSNLVAFAHRTLEVAEGGCARGDVALLLRSSYIDPRAIFGDVAPDVGRKMLRDLARALEETATAAGETPASQLAATVLRSSIVRRRGMAGLGQAALRLGQMLDRVRTAPTRGDQARAAHALWREIGLDMQPPPSTALSRDANKLDLDDLTARARDAEAWSALLSTLREYEESAIRLGATEPTSLCTFRDELFSSFARRPCETRGASGAVRIVRFADLAPCAGQIVLFADADDGAWRKRDSDLVPSDLVARLDAVTDPPIRPIFSSRESAALARLVLATSVAELVIFTYRARSEDGETMSPASILPAGAPSSVWRPAVWPSRPLSQSQWVMRELAERPEAASEIAPDCWHRSELERQREESFGEEIPRDHPLATTLPRGEPFRTILTDESGGGDRAIAASSLDALSACGFRGFVGEVLRPRRVHRADNVVNRRDEGQLTHLALDAAFRSTAGLWSARPRARELIRRTALLAAERALSREHFASGLTGLAVDQVLSATRAVIEWSLDDETWDFVSAEQPFGEDEGWPPVVLEAGGTRVRVRGRIDRVDVAHDSSRVRVIDYKTRERSAESHTLAFGTTKFQLALYARAASSAMDRPPGEGLYLGTQRLRPGAAPRKHREQWEAAHETISGVPRFEARLTALVETLRAGDLAVRPVAPSSCIQCDFDGVCRKPRFAPTPAEDDADEGR